MELLERKKCWLITVPAPDSVRQDPARPTLAWTFVNLQYLTSPLRGIEGQKIEGRERGRRGLRLWPIGMQKQVQHWFKVSARAERTLGTVGLDYRLASQPKVAGPFVFILHQ